MGGGSKGQLAQIRLYAREMGIAFQIDDDLLDLIGEPQLLGKPVGNSLAQGRPMLPIIYLWKVSSEATRKKLRRLAEGGWNRDELAGLLEQHGVVDWVLQIQQRHIAAAIEALKGFRHSTGIDALRALASSITARASR